MVAEQPDIFATIQGAFRDAGALMRTRMNVYWILAAVCALAVLLTLRWAGSVTDVATEQQLRIQGPLQSINLCSAIAWFFILPAAIRTVRPEFKLTFMLVLGLIGIGLVVGFATEIGLVLLIAPGIWVGVKLSQATWAYVMPAGKNPFEESWEMATGHFWETFGFYLLLGILVGLVLFAVLLIPVGVAVFVPLSGVVLGPIAFLGYVYCYHVSVLGNMRWMLELRRLGGGAAERPAPGAPV